MKRLLLLIILLAALGTVHAQTGSPNLYFVKYLIKVPVRAPAINYRIVLTIEPYSGPNTVVTLNSNTSAEKIFDDVINSTSSIRNVYIDVSNNGNSPWRYTFDVSGSYLIAYDRTGTWSGDNFGGDYTKIPYISLRVYPNILINNQDGKTPPNNIYCENDKVHLGVNYYAGNGGGPWVYWQYRIGGTGNFTYLPNPYGYTSASDFSLKDIFGDNYKDYLNTRIDFRAASSNGLGRDMYLPMFQPGYDPNVPIKPIRPDEGSNFLTYYFYPSTNMPSNVKAIQPACSNSAGTAMTITFQRAMLPTEQITSITLYKEVNGVMNVFDQYQTPITTLDATNCFTWSGTKPMDGGKYSVKIEGKYGATTQCNNTDYVFNVVPPPPVSLTASSTNILCVGASTGTITVTPGGGAGNGDITKYDYSINNGATWQSANNSFTGLPKGTYTVLVRDGNGCVSLSPQTVTLTEPAVALSAKINTVADPKGATTKDGSITLTIAGGTAPYTYSWNNGATSRDISGLDGGTYSVLVTDANNCTASVSTTLVAPPPIQIQFTETGISCNGESDGGIQAKVTGGVPPYSYQWSTNGTLANINNLKAGTYSLLVTDDNGITATLSYVLKEPTVLTAQLTPKAVSCFGGGNGTITTVVSGGTAPYYYAWSNGASTANLTGLSAGNFNVSITDNNGCNIKQSATVTTPQALAITGATTPPTRYGSADGSIDITVTGGTTPYTYSWSNGKNTEDLTAITDGQYTVTVMDANGCFKQMTFTLKQPDPLAVILFQTGQVRCNSAATGALQVTVTGGVWPYTFNWSNGATDSVITSLQAGNYTITVTDKSGVTSVKSMTITEPPALTLSLSATEVSCSGQSDGTVTATTGGGVVPYTYLWSNGSTAANLPAVNGGTYSLTLTDANGCKTNAAAVVRNPNALDVQAVASDPICNNGSDGKIDLTVTGGRTPYVFAWDNNAVTEDISHLPAGDYHVLITDNSGCKIAQSWHLTNPPPVVIDLGRDRTLCKGQTLVLDATIPNGASYQWSTDAGFKASTPILQISDPAVYKLITTNNRGCTGQGQIKVSYEDRDIAADFLMSTQVNKGEQFTAVNISYPSADKITWTFPANAVVKSSSDLLAELLINQSGLFRVIMTAYRGGCEAIAVKEIMVNDAVSLPDPVSTQETLFKQAVLRPNPNKGQFYVDIEVTDDVAVNYRLLDISRNRIIYERKAQLNKGVKQSEYFDVPGLPPGVYVLLIESAKEKIILKLLII